MASSKLITYQYSIVASSKNFYKKIRGDSHGGHGSHGDYGHGGHGHDDYIHGGHGDYGHGGHDDTLGGEGGGQGEEGTTHLAGEGDDDGDGDGDGGEQEPGEEGDETATTTARATATRPGGMETI